LNKSRLGWTTYSATSSYHRLFPAVLGESESNLKSIDKISPGPQSKTKRNFKGRKDKDLQELFIRVSESS